MPKPQKNDKILVSGSIAYDRIMDFPGFFKDHILPEKIHILNVSFLITSLKESFGGTAGNISYNLSLLGLRPTLLGVVGSDFNNYKQWLNNNKIDISKIKKDKNIQTAAAYIMTDKDDNQITGFFPGPDNRTYPEIVKKIKNIRLAIISPEAADRMTAYARLYKQLKVPYIFDPGQQIPALSNTQLKQSISGSYVLIGNDYEIEVIKKRLKLSLLDLQKLTSILIITRGNKGSVIYSENKKIIIPPAKAKNGSDPTGAGDAYRAGLIKGLLAGWPLEKTGRLAGLVSVYTVEKYGTQTHSFTMAGLKKRFRENYKNYSL